MIEIEIKLKVKEFPNLSKLKKIDEKRILDIYYDTLDYKMISTGNFLRNRNNKKIDFKLAIGDLSHTYCQETRFDYNNFCHNEGIKKIFSDIGIEYNSNYNSFEDFIRHNKLQILATIDKQRTVYQLDNLIISLDDVKDTGKFMEIETDLPDDATFDKDSIRQQMFDVLKAHNLLPQHEIVNVGYVELYLKQHNAKAYNLGLYKA